MISSRIITAICLGAALCAARTINISGTVKDTAGVGISGATVTLEKTSLSTTSGADGGFTLPIISTQTQQNVNRRTETTTPIQLQNGKMTIRVLGETPVAICIHDVAGRRIYNSKKTYGSGTHALQAPLQFAGVHLYRVTIGDEAYLFKCSPFGTFTRERASVFDGTSTLAKLAKATAVDADVISVVKLGQLNYRDSVQIADTSGIMIKMIPNAGNVKDADSIVYQTVRIGNQVWTVENLKTTKYNDGTAIPYVTDRTLWSTRTTAAYCCFDNNAANLAKYGALYNWFAVNMGKVAPAGWRVATTADWDTLQNYLIRNKYNWDGTTTGNKIAKSMAAKTGWSRHATAGNIGNSLSMNNASGFSALPGGYRHGGGDFYGQNAYGFWWKAGVSSGSNAYVSSLASSYSDLINNNFDMRSGYSVRLVRN